MSTRFQAVSTADCRRYATGVRPLGELSLRGRTPAYDGWSGGGRQRKVPCATEPAIRRWKTQYTISTGTTVITIAANSAP